MKFTGFTAIALVLGTFSSHAYAADPVNAVSGTTAPVLTPTRHPHLPADRSQLWLGPDRSAVKSTDPANREAVAALKLQAKGDYAKALTALTTPTVLRSAVADYAAYYAGVAQLRLGKSAQARQTFHTLASRPVLGYLTQAAAFGEADAAEATGDHAAAVVIYERLVTEKTGATDEVLMRLGKAAALAGDSAKARDAYARVYYEFPLSDVALSAGLELSRNGLGQSLPAADRARFEMTRAERLYNARQFGAARIGFETARPLATDADRDRIDLRLAECDYQVKRTRQAREALKRLTTEGTNQAEAQYFSAMAANELNEKANFVSLVRRLVDQFPTSRWSEQALDQLATAYILDDNDDAADATFKELYDRFPKGAFADRASWKLGWRAYREQRYADAIRVFERAAADFPRSDYRPQWLYWAGVAHQQLNETALADERYLLTATDYLNSYYGRLAAARLGGRAPVPRLVTASNVTPPAEEAAPPLPPNASAIRTLLALELYDDALNELRYAQLSWGDSPAVQATIAWVHQRQGQFETGSKRFNLVRGAITSMRRAYPQFMAAGGEELPRDLLTVIFPLSYWELIRKYSAQYSLDPYLMAALIAQESTFVPDIKSYAKAVGLMQLMPGTGRQYAKKTGTRFGTSTLTNAEANIRLGTAYFADLVHSLGDTSLALASYNAGESPVRRWMADKPDLPRDEFIDDIPYPQTQGYVKRILGTAEDYRRLYGDRPVVDELTPAAKVASVAQGVGAAPAPGSPASKPVKSVTKKTTKKKASTKRTHRG